MIGMGNRTRAKANTRQARGSKPSYFRMHREDVTIWPRCVLHPAVVHSWCATETESTQRTSYLLYLPMQTPRAPLARWVIRSTRRNHGQPIAVVPLVQHAGAWPPCRGWDLEAEEQRQPEGGQVETKASDGQR